MSDREQMPISIQNPAEAEARLRVWLTISDETPITFIEQGVAEDDGFLPPQEPYWLFQVDQGKHYRVYQGGAVRVYFLTEKVENQV